jgi:hypothetical protein
MSARCSLNNWGGYSDNPQAPSPLVYQPPTSGSTWSATYVSDMSDVAYAGNIPEQFNYLDDTDPSDGITAGYSDANEFAPVMVVRRSRCRGFLQKRG